MSVHVQRMYSLNDYPIACLKNNSTFLEFMCYRVHDVATVSSVSTLAANPRNGLNVGGRNGPWPERRALQVPLALAEVPSNSAEQRSTLSSPEC